MKVIAINGSPNKKGNTTRLVNYVFEELKILNIKTELIELTGKNLKGCKACRQCFINKNKKCIIKSDKLNNIVKKMSESDGIIFASPTYFSNVTSNMKSLIDRSGLVGRANGFLYQNKVAAAVVAVRRAGAVKVFDAINNFFLINKMIVPGSIYWNMGFGLLPGEVEHDDEGIQTMRELGKNMGWLLKKINK